MINIPLKIILIGIIVIALGAVYFLFQPSVRELNIPGTFKEDLRTLPKAQPPPPFVSFTGNQNDIKILPLAFAYKKGETIAINIANKSPQPLTFFLGPGCGIFFERNVNGVWQQQGMNSYDFSRASCIQTTINARETYKISKLIEAPIAPSGSYRIVFQYVEGNVFSNEFTVEDATLSGPQSGVHIFK